MDHGALLALQANGRFGDPVVLSTDGSSCQWHEKAKSGKQQMVWRLKSNNLKNQTFESEKKEEQIKVMLNTEQKNLYKKKQEATAISSF